MVQRGTNPFTTGQSGSSDAADLSTSQQHVLLSIYVYTAVMHDPGRSITHLPFLIPDYDFGTIRDLWARPNSQAPQAKLLAVPLSCLYTYGEGLLNRDWHNGGRDWHNGGA